jgi:predicted extracellular nuclease
VSQPAPGTDITTYTANSGNSGTGNFYAFGVDNNIDRALGGVGSGGAYFGSPVAGAIAGWFAVAATNNTGATINTLNVGFDGEQWRNSGNVTAQTSVLEYGFGTTFQTVPSWIAPGGNFDWASPVATATAAAVDGNVAGLVAGRGGTLNTLNWTNGSNLWFRWVERNDAGNDHGLGIDNFTLSTAAATPTVNLAVSANAGTEAGTTNIIVAANASANVTGAQTVTLTVTGTNITTGDYTLDGAATNTVTLTIPNGATASNFVTFAVVNDTLLEGNETAVLTISAPSAGITLGTTTIQNIAITDDDAPAVPNVQITEYMYTGNGGEFIEFTNLGTTPVDFTGWSFDDNSRTPTSFSLSAFGVVAAGESVILTESTELDFRNAWTLLPATTKVIGGLNQNLGRADEINIYDNANTLVDRLTYDDQTIPGTIRTQGASGWTPVTNLAPQTINTTWRLSTVADAQNSYASTNGDIGNPGAYNATPPTVAGVTIVQSGGSTAVNEAGTTTDTYTIALDSTPTGAVNITVTADAQTTISSDGVTFGATANIALTNTTAQTITVRAVDDAVAETSPHTGTITHSIASSADPAYSNALTPIANVTANVVDNDSAPTAAPQTSRSLQRLGTFTGTGAEISAYDPTTRRLFVIAGNDKVQVLNISNPASPVLEFVVDVAPYGFAANSVAIANGIVAVAVESNPKTDPGKVVFFNTAGTFLNQVTVGALPDMLTFTPDGNRVIVANEGEPNSYGQPDSVDPVGSVSIVDITGGVAAATVATASFASFIGNEAALRAQGIRITGPGSNAAQDFEPEYITVSADGQTAYVILQENNALATVNIATATVTSVVSLGRKDHSLPGNGLDASDRDNATQTAGAIKIRNEPVFGLYQPDAIASFTVGGQTFLITANEGDARDYTGFEEGVRLGDASYVLDPTVFPNAATLKQVGNLGRLNVTRATGDTDGDGDFDRIEVFGARSFSILNASGAQVFDSGDQIERLTASLVPASFNSNQNPAASSFDSRSDDKGPEPEGVTIGVVNGRTYAFVGLERVGGVLVYDVTTPTSPAFVDYINTPGDLGPEGLTFIPAAGSPNGKPLLAVTNEVSRTTTIYQFDPVTKISSIQGNASTQTAASGRTDLSPFNGLTVTIEGVVTADYQTGSQLRGFFIQEENADQDGNGTTSEGIFVFTGNTAPLDVQEGQVVRVTGAVSEFFGMTQVTASAAGSIVAVNTGNNLNLVTPTAIDIPVTGNRDAFYEQYEGMRVQFTDKLVVSEYFEVARYGQIVLTEGSRPFQYSHTDNTPTAAEFSAFRENLNNRRIILDDDNNTQNAPLPAGRFFYPQPGGFSTGTQGTNFFRGGDSVTNLTGVLHWSFAGQAGTDAWRLRPTQANPVNFTVENPRPLTPPVVGGNVKVASFNVLNYFNTIDTTGGNGSPRGADSADEFNRQNEKLIAALRAIDADVFGLVEIENNGTAVAELVNRLNAVVGAGTYSFINTGVVGTDQITVALIYKSANVRPKGNFAALTDAAFTDPNNTGQQRSRPAIAQTFEVTNPNNPDFGAVFNVVVNHLKSKGAAEATGADLDQNDGQGAWNSTRTKAADFLVNNWIPSDPTRQGDPDYLIIGDLNAYKGETPITTIKNAGYTDLLESRVGNDAYSFLFDGQLGYLDYALASSSLNSQVTGVADWRINADEVPVFDYNNNVDDGAGESSFEAKPTGNNLYEPNAFRTSDHDPVIVGLDLTTPTTPPTGTATLVTNANEVLTINGGTGAKQLQFTVTGREAGLVNEVGVFLVDDDQGRINGIAPGQAGYAQAALARGQVVFSALSENSFPSLNFPRNLTFQSGNRFQFFLVQNGSIDSARAGQGGNLLFSSTAGTTVFDPIQVGSASNGVVTVRFEDGGADGDRDFNDLVLNVQVTTTAATKGAGLQNQPQTELIDLRGQTTASTASFTVNSEARYNNTIGLYTVNNAQGQVTDPTSGATLSPGDAGYAQAAMRLRVATLDRNGSAPVNLSGGRIYAPFLIANSTVDNFLATNPMNQSRVDTVAYFAYLGANPDRQDHIRLLGDNVFGFEDLLGGGDKDFNDIVAQVRIA